MIGHPMRCKEGVQGSSYKGGVERTSAKGEPRRTLTTQQRHGRFAVDQGARSVAVRCASHSDEKGEAVDKGVRRS